MEILKHSEESFSLVVIFKLVMLHKKVENFQLWPIAVARLFALVSYTPQCDPNIQLDPMKQHALKIVNNCLNTNIDSYSVTSGTNAIKLFLSVIYEFS